MKRSFKAREAALMVLPVLALGAFAWTRMRAEQTGARPDGLAVAGVNFGSAKGRFQAAGLSHEMKVTIRRSGPRPDWWGNWHLQAGVDPLAPDEPASTKGFPRNQTILYGAALTTTSLEHGKPVIKTQWRDKQIGAPLINDELVFSHEMALAHIPASAGEVTFRAVYCIGGQAPIRINRIVRKRGEVLAQNSPHNPGAILVSIRATPFEFYCTGRGSGFGSTVHFDFKHPPVARGQNPTVVPYDLEISDRLGKRTKVDFQDGPLISAGYGGRRDDENTPTQTKAFLAINISPKARIAEPLTLRGKLSLDDGWPIPFSLRLPRHQGF